jgi:ribonuclease-3 family protein
LISKETLPKDPYLYNGLALAYIGDAVYEVYVRQRLLQRGGTRVHLLHKQATGYVSAKAQARVLSVWLKKMTFSEKEMDMIKRGRNAKSGTSPKNTELHTYRLSTAFESLIGYLYLDGQEERLAYLIDNAFEVLEGKEGEHE